MVKGAVTVIGGGGRAEQALQPEAQRPHIQRHPDIALILDRLIERVLGVAALAQQRVVAERALGPQAGVLKRQPSISADNRDSSVDFTATRSVYGVENKRRNSRK